MSVIKVENLYKQYQLGQVSTGTIAHDFNRWMHKIRGKEDPYERITGLNNREKASESNFVWALENVNFEVNQGDVLGIVGRNGAGKSTLLKILSKVTSPTKGEIKIRGKIASLLEVGTGFHPELTGRENIYLNGAILGMTKSEIRSKFDEIVAFSGVEKYIDTPVKRYSSGMYVRLAFAVAAHLEPEILIVDEVLAVGDAEFQKKCLGKMKDVSNQGRTVLFVSHNMVAVEALCTRGIYLKDGTIFLDSDIRNIVREYFSDSIKLNEGKKVTDIVRENKNHGVDLKIISVDCLSTIFWRDNLKLNFKIQKNNPILSDIEFGFGINDLNGIRICTFESPETYSFYQNDVLEFTVDLSEPKFVPGKYYLSLGIRSNVQTLDFIDNVISFDVLEINKGGESFGFTLGANISGNVDTKASVLLSSSVGNKIEI
jgi:lipopolysaccharide transport system ATP-binding protein